MKIPINYIIELGLIRKRDNCAKCSKKMDVDKYHIQLCKKCRTEELDKFSKDSYEREVATMLNKKKKQLENEQPRKKVFT